MKRISDLRTAVGSLVGAAVVTAVVGSGASAQQPAPVDASKPAVRSEVNVGGASSPAPSAAPSAPGASPATPGGAAQPSAASQQGLLSPPIKRVWTRNPFVPPGVSAVAETPAAPTTPVAAAPPKKEPGPTGRKATPAPAKAPEVAVNPPTFALVGLLTSGSFNRALLVTSTGAREARVGDTVEGYTVKGIDMQARVVLVEMNKKAFKVGLPSDSPTGGNSTGSPGGAPAGGAPPMGAPMPSGGAPLPPPPPPGGPGRPGGR